MRAFKDLHGLVEVLEGRGKLYRFSEPIDKDTELVPFYRVQMRGLEESERKAFLFENVVGSGGKRHDMSVLAGVYGVSEEILATGIGCGGYVEMLERWHEGLMHPLAPVEVGEGAVQEKIHMGEEIKELGLDELPVPVEEPGFSGMIRTGLPMITKDPETGIRNVGTYNGFFRGRDRIAAGIGPNKHAMFYHREAARRLGKGLPIAIVIGCSPEVMLVGSARIPYGLDELGIAGGIVGAPVELVRCRTIPIEVPAHAEVVIEGVLSTDQMEPRGAFGEYPGHLNVDRTPCPVMQVTAITHRSGAMFTPVPVGFIPNDCNLVFGFCYSAQLYHRLKYECDFPVEEVYFPQMGGGSNFCLIRVRDGTAQESISRLLREAAAGSDAKYVVAVDSDINLRDSELVMWALSFRTQPKEDVLVVPGGKRRFDPSGIHRTGRLDPSANPIRAGGSESSSGRGKEFYLTLINATRKYPYPPLALPRRDYMERALEIWRGRKDLPPPRLRQPWYGYTLGHWNEDLQAEADLIAQGKYIEVGRRNRT